MAKAACSGFTNDTKWKGDRCAVEHDCHSDGLQQLEKWTERNLGIFIKF